MPIKQVNSRQEYLNLSLTKFEYVLLIFYSQNNENKWIQSGGNEQVLNTCLEYLDRLSNSDKYNHVLFVEINMDSAKGFYVYPNRIPHLFLFEKDDRNVAIRTDICCRREEIRKLLENIA